MSKFILNKPIKDGEQEITELNLDFDKLTGNDIINIEAEYKAEQGENFSLLKERDKGYLAYVVARAAGVHVSVIKKLSAKDFTKATVRAQNFLLI